MNVEVIEPEEITLEGYPFDLIACPYCDMDQSDHDALIGRFGRTSFYRCRHCGGQWDSRDCS